MKCSCQERLLPGDGILEKWEFAREPGFDSIELRGTEDWNGRLDDLRGARERGVVISSVCLIYDRFIGDFDPTRRRDATDHMKDLLSGIAELGGTGAATPAAYGLASKRLPPLTCRARMRRTGASSSTRWRNSVSTPRGRVRSSFSNP